MADKLDVFLKRRNEILTTLDIERARELMKDTTDEVRLIALHKARYECTAIASELRHESASWLRDRGFSGLSGPLLPEGELPK